MKRKCSFRFLSKLHIISSLALNMDVPPSFLPILLQRQQKVLLFPYSTGHGHTLQHRRKYRNFHTSQFLFPFQYLRRNAQRSENSTPNCSAGRLWQPCLEVGLSKLGSTALTHYYVKSEREVFERQKNPTPSLSVNIL